ncbi:MAG: MFS transporter, partial [Pirellulales bacterium]
VKDNLDAREAARMFSLLALIGGLAPILAPIVGATVIRFADWRAIFLVMASAAALVLAAQVVVLPETRSKEAEARARAENPVLAYVRLLRDRRILGYLLAAAGNGICLFTYIANSAAVFMGGYGLSPTAFSLVFGANAIGLLAANQLNRHMLSRLDVDVMLRRVSLSAVVFAVLFVFFASTHAGGMLVLGVLLFFGIASTAVVQANVMAGALSVDPLRAGSIAALYGATTFTFGMLSSSLVAALEGGAGGAMALVIAAGFATCAIALRFMVLSGDTNKREQEHD